MRPSVRVPSNRRPLLMRSPLKFAGLQTASRAAVNSDAPKLVRRGWQKPRPRPEGSQAHGSEEVLGELCWLLLDAAKTFFRKALFACGIASLLVVLRTFRIRHTRLGSRMLARFRHILVGAAGARADAVLQTFL